MHPLQRQFILFDLSRWKRCRTRLFETYPQLLFWLWSIFIYLTGQLLLHWFAKASGYPAKTLAEIIIQVNYLDVGWYLDIARQGYWIDPTRLGQSVVFFPLFPWLIRGMQALTSMGFEASAIVVQKLSAAAMFAALVWWVRGFAPPPHFSVVTLCTVFLTFHPAAIFLAVPYTEALFLSMVFLLAGLLERAPRQSTPWLACLCALGMGLTRPSGLFLLPCEAIMLVLLWKQPAQRNIALSLIAGVLVAIVILTVTLQYYVGEPFAFYVRRFEGWKEVQSLDNILQLIQLPIGGRHMGRYLVIYAHLAGCFLLWSSAQRTLGLFCLLLILVPVYQGKLGDMARFCLSASPAWILFVLYTAQWPWAIGMLGILSGLYAFHLLILWLQRGWVG
jgi:hypothetical protein